MSSAPSEVALPVLEEAITFGREILKHLRELKAPIVAINPDYRPTDVEALRSYGIKSVLMSGAGHFMMMEDPEAFIYLLTKVADKFFEST